MSLYTQIQIVCDVCEEVFIEEIDDPDDVDYEIERHGGSIGVEINDHLYEHMCENCYNEVSYCEVCDQNIWSDNAYWCSELVMCDNCVEEQHLELLATGEIEMIEHCCAECDWEFPQPAKELTRKALVTL